VKYLLILAVLLAACGEPMKSGGKTYECYGIADDFARNPRQDPEVRYEMESWNWLWVALTLETVIVPIYIVGWQVYCPVGFEPTPAPQQEQP
jgi:hypothetical protein